MKPADAKTRPEPDEKPDAPKVTKPNAVAANVEDDEDDEDDLPDDPAKLRALVRKKSRQLRKAQRKLEDAGLSRAEEKRLTDAVAELSVQVEAIKSKLDVTAEDVEEVKTDDAPPPSKPATCWLTIL